MPRPYEGKNKLKKPKEELFARWYAASLNGVQSAIKAGLGGTYNSSAGYATQLLKDEHVQARVSYLIGERMEKASLQADNVVDEVAKVAFGNVMDFVEFNKSGTDFKFNKEALKSGGAIIQEISLQKGKNPKKGIKTHDKMKALDMLMRYMELYERSEQAMRAEEHAAKMAGSGLEQPEVEDDGFLEAMNDIADNMETDEFVITEGKDDVEE